MNIIDLGKKGKKIVWKNNKSKKFSDPKSNVKCVQLIILAHRIEELQKVYDEIEKIDITTQSGENLYEEKTQEAEALDYKIGETYDGLMGKDWDHVSICEDTFWEVIETAIGCKGK